MDARGHGDSSKPDAENAYAWPELAADLVGSGITLCGGGSLLRGLPELIERETELQTRVAEDPMEAVARGTCIFLENLELYAQFLEGGDDLI